MKTTLTIVIVALLIIGGVFAYLRFKSSPETQTPTQNQPAATTTTTAGNEQATTTEEKEPVSVIGKSVEGRDIKAYHYGEGDTELLFVGGIHGGYEWNTVIVAHELMDYLEKSPQAIPGNLKVTVIPVLNPDGLSKVVGTAGRFTAADVPATQAETVPGRFNAHNVDLNRNFDCDWKSNATWQDTSVSGGSAAFSEPEAQAIKAYVESNKPSAAVVWYSAVGGVFASNCHEGVLPETNTILKTYADASKYSAYSSFNFYEITGDMVNWFAKKKIPAISVLLTNHEDTEWNKNKAGIDALLKHYAE